VADGDATALSNRALHAVCLLAISLAGIGIYAVVSYSMGQRTREIGIRLALGAQRADVLGMILRQGLTPDLLGER
jgi:putative ABC transport system permease protein